MEPETKTRELIAFYAWMDELNAEAVRRGLSSDDWPMPDEVAHSLNCWMTDFRRGLSPVKALDFPLKRTGWYFMPETAPCLTCGGEAHRIEEARIGEANAECPNCGLVDFDLGETGKRRNL